MALALPAAIAPPAMVASVTPSGGSPRTATAIAARVTPRSSTVTCGFIRATYAPRAARPERVRAAAWEAGADTATVLTCCMWGAPCLAGDTPAGGDGAV